MIAWSIYSSFIGALAVAAAPRKWARAVALLSALAGLIFSLAAFFSRKIDFAHFTTIARVPWVPLLGMNYQLAVDGISVVLCLVTGITAVSAVLFSWDIEERPNEFFF